MQRMESFSVRVVVNRRVDDLKEENGVVVKARRFVDSWEVLNGEVNAVVLRLVDYCASRDRFE